MRSSLLITSLKDYMVSGNRALRLTTLTDSGNYNLRILPFLGDENRLPFVEERLHFLRCGSNKATPIRCGGMSCKMCSSHTLEDSEKTAKRHFYYAIINRELTILSVPKTFTDCLFGKVGQPSEVTRLMLSGTNVFSTLNGSDLEIRRTNFDNTADWFFNIRPPTMVDLLIVEELKVAPLPSNFFFTLDDNEMQLLGAFLKTGNVKYLPKSLRNTNLAKGAA